MLLTNNEKYWSQAWSFKDHGKSWERVHASDHPPGFRWLHEGIGSNWRLTEIQAAIGRIQLRKLDGWVARRRHNAHSMSEAFKDVDALRLTFPPENVHHSYYKYYAFVRSELLKSDWSRDRILAALHAEGVPGWSGSCPEIYLEKAISQNGQIVLPVARELGENSIMLPVHPTLDQADMDDIILGVRKVLHAATG
jgi:dTDP-4-amino-4,6-dideoxygalactose transaminase